MTLPEDGVTLVWATDLHLNHAQPDRLAEFRSDLQRLDPKAVIVCGDFSESVDLSASLKWMGEAVQRPVYFCLGNHDFYYDSIERVRNFCQDVCRDHANLNYLTVMPPLEIAPGVGLLGHDGWADGRSPSYERSVITMHDARLIADFHGLDKRQRWDVMKNLADDSANWLRRELPAALAQWNRVLLATHVPPLRQACWYQGGISDNHWAPHFVNRIFGDTLLEIMDDYPQHQVTVLCGHTHGAGITLPRPNVQILTGTAEYGTPCVAGTFHFPATPGDNRIGNWPRKPRP